MLVRREANSKDVMGAYIQRVGSKPANPQCVSQRTQDHSLSLSLSLSLSQAGV